MKNTTFPIYLRAGTHLFVKLINKKTNLFFCNDHQPSIESNGLNVKYYLKNSAYSKIDREEYDEHFKAVVSDINKLSSL